MPATNTNTMNTSFVILLSTGAFEVQIACNNMAIDQSRPAKGGSDMQVDTLYSILSEQHTLIDCLILEKG